jgi:hypothetical protein
LAPWPISPRLLDPVGLEPRRAVVRQLFSFLGGGIAHGDGGERGEQKFLHRIKWGG